MRVTRRSGTLVKPQPTQIKDKIEHLIERQFLQRDEKNRSVYIYSICLSAAGTHAEISRRRRRIERVGVQSPCSASNKRAPLTRNVRRPHKRHMFFFQDQFVKRKWEPSSSTSEYHNTQKYCSAAQEKAHEKKPFRRMYIGRG